MAGTREQREHQVERLREDFQHVTGTPYRHFYCPITHRDEPVDLCMGHVINEGLGRSSSTTILQGSDVDAFYGSCVEADLITAVTSRLLPTSALFLDAKMSRALGARLCVNGEEWRIYEYRNGRHAPDHTPVLFKGEDGRTREVVIAKSPDEIEAIEGQTAELVVNRDYTHTMIAGLLKAAHLTLFRLLGYSYALSTGGVLIGKDVLGTFYDRNRGRKVSEIRDLLPEHFHEWRNAVRPIQSIGDNDYQGTVDDGTLLTLHLSSGPVFALGVLVRTNDDFHQVLVPAIPVGGSLTPADSADALATYVEFIRSPPPFFHAKTTRYNAERAAWETSPDDPIRFEWPSES